MQQIDFFNLNTRETPREILESDFPRIGKLPIKGGWGYSQATACVIDRSDAVVEPGVPFDGVALEYVFAEYRIYEELIIFRPKGEKYAHIRRELKSQALSSHGGKYYDHLTFQVWAFREEDFEWLKAKYEGPDGVRNPDFDVEAHNALHTSRLHTGIREYWFDITSFYGR